MKFQEFGTFGICQKFSKIGRYSSLNLSKFVIFKKCLVYWIMHHYMQCSIFWVKMTIPMGSYQKRQFINRERCPNLVCQFPLLHWHKQFRNVTKILLDTKYLCNRGFISMIADAPELSFRKGILYGNF